MPIYVCWVSDSMHVGALVVQLSMTFGDDGEIIVGQLSL